MGFIYLGLAVAAFVVVGYAGIKKEEKDRENIKQLEEMVWNPEEKEYQKRDYIDRVNYGFECARRKYRRIDYDLSEGLMFKPDDLERGLYDPNTRFGECDSVVDRKHSTICSRTGDGHIYIIR